MRGAVALPALFGRFPDLPLAAAPGTVRQLESFMTNGYQHLPVRLTP